MSSLNDEKWIEDLYKTRTKEKIKNLLKMIPMYVLIIIMISLGIFIYDTKEAKIGFYILEIFLVVIYTLNRIKKDLEQLILPVNYILLHECDAERYLKLTKEGVRYGKQHSLKRSQKAVFLYMEQSYVLALIACRHVKEAKDYLKYDWTNKKNTKLYKTLCINCQFASAYQDQNYDAFPDENQKEYKIFKKSSLFAAEKLMVLKQYQSVIAKLDRFVAKSMYEEVMAQYLLGLCYEKTGEIENARKCMEYVIQHGNTLPNKKEAEEWMNKKEFALTKEWENNPQNFVIENRPKEKTKLIFQFGAVLGVTGFLTSLIFSYIPVKIPVLYFLYGEFVILLILVLVRGRQTDACITWLTKQKWGSIFKRILIIIGNLLLIFSFLIAFFQYDLNYRVRTIDQSISPDKKYTVYLKSVGSPILFSSAEGKLILNKRTDNISIYPISIADDGGPIRKESWKVYWTMDGVQISLFGSEQSDETVFLNYDGEIEVLPAGQTEEHMQKPKEEIKEAEKPISKEMKGYQAIYKTFFEDKGKSFIEDYDAKGHSTVILFENLDLIEYLVYDRDSKNGNCGIFVYYKNEKQSDGSWSLQEAQILDFFAYEYNSGKVIKGEKKGWEEAGSEEYQQLTWEP